MPIEPLRVDWDQGDFVDAAFLNRISALVNTMVSAGGSGSWAEGPPGPPGQPGPPGSGGGGGAPVRPKVYHVDDYGADPTGVNPSDAAVTAARAAMGTSPGLIEFGIGTYKIMTAGLNCENNMYLGPSQGVIGQGKSLTVIDYRGQNAAIELRQFDFDFTQQHWPSAGVRGVYIFGWGNSNTNTYGIRYGDIWGVTISDTHISGFNRAGCVGLYGDHRAASSERCDVDIVIEQCTTISMFEGRPDSGTALLTPDYQPQNSSFDYSKYRITFVAVANQDVFVLRSRVANTLTGGGASMNGVTLELIGNCVAGDSTTGNTGALMRVGSDDNDYAFLTGELHISVEVSTSSVSGTPAPHYDFMQYARSRVNAVGAINLIPIGGTDFAQGTSTNERFFFSGMLKRSPTLGSTGDKNQSQSLQVVTQALGRYYSNPTASAQRIYIKAATGGTFRIGYNGTFTSALAHNATVAAVQAAINLIPALNGVQVWNAQARYVNNVQQDEHGYGFEFTNALRGTVVSALTVDSASLTGTSEVIVHNYGSPNTTWALQIETGNLFKITAPPGVYRLDLNIGELSKSEYLSFYNDSPFGLAQADIWIQQPTSGGNVVLEGPFFAPRSYSGSTYSFQWVDSSPPVLSTDPDAWDVIRLSSVNFNTWIGQHLNKGTGAATSNNDGTAQI